MNTQLIPHYSQCQAQKSPDQPLKDLAQWRARIVRRLPADQHTVSIERLTTAFGDIFERYPGHLDSIAMKGNSAPANPLVREHLQILSNAYPVTLRHRIDRQLHPVQECSEDCDNQQNFYYIRNKYREPGSGGSLGNIVIFPTPENMLELATFYSRLCSNPDFRSEVMECKFAAPEFYHLHNTPAIVYLHTNEPSYSLLDHLQSNLSAFSKGGIHLAGASEVRPGIWLTQLTPSVSGCQPYSQARIVFSSFFQKAEDDTAAIKLAAAKLGYNPDHPERLADKTPAFESLVFFTENILKKNWSKIKHRPTLAGAYQILGLKPRAQEPYNRGLCRQALNSLIFRQGVRATPRAKAGNFAPYIDSRAALWDAMELHIANFKDSNMVKDPGASILYVSIKPKYLHLLLERFAYPSTKLKSLLADVNWKIIMKNDYSYEKLPTFFEFRAGCSAETLHEIATELRAGLPKDFNVDMNLYGAPKQPDWADLPGFEKHSEGMSITQQPETAEDYEEPHAHFVKTGCEILARKHTQNIPVAVEDILSYELFQDGYGMNNPSRKRADLASPLYHRMDVAIGLVRQ